MITVEQRVKELIQQGKSAQIYLEFYRHDIGNVGGNRQEREAFVKAHLNGMAYNWDKNYVTPTTPEDWEALEKLNEQSVTIGQWENAVFTAKPGCRLAEYCNGELFDGIFSDGTLAKDLRDWKKIEQERARSEEEAYAAGYGRSRMGGWVETK